MEAQKIAKRNDKRRKEARLRPKRIVEQSFSLLIL